jgi:hypothetical protein
MNADKCKAGKGESAMNDWINPLLRTMVGVCALGFIINFTRMAVLARRRRETTWQDSTPQIDRLYLGALLLMAAGFICGTILETGQESRAAMGGLALCALISVWKECRGADASHLVGPVVSIKLPRTEAKKL